MDGNWTSEGKKKLYYRCPECGDEWTRWKPIEERKVRGWCANCKHLVTPYKTEKTQTTERENVRVTKLKPLW